MENNKKKAIILVDEDGVQTKAFYMDEIEREGKLFIAVALDPNKSGSIDEDSIEMAVFRVDRNSDTDEEVLSALDAGPELDALNEIFYYRIQKVFEMTPSGEFPFVFDDEPSSIEESDYAIDAYPQIPKLDSDEDEDINSTDEINYDDGSVNFDQVPNILAQEEQMEEEEEEQEFEFSSNQEDLENIVIGEQEIELPEEAFQMPEQEETTFISPSDRPMWDMPQQPQRPVAAQGQRPQVAPGQGMQQQRPMAPQGQRPQAPVQAMPQQPMMGQRPQQQGMPEQRLVASQGQRPQVAPQGMPPQRPVAAQGQRPQIAPQQGMPQQQQRPMAPQVQRPQAPQQGMPGQQRSMAPQGQRPQAPQQGMPQQQQRPMAPQGQRPQAPGQGMQRPMAPQRPPVQQTKPVTKKPSNSFDDDVDDIFKDIDSI